MATFDELLQQSTGGQLTNLAQVQDLVAGSSQSQVNAPPASVSRLFTTFEQRHQRIGPQGIPVPLDTKTGAPFMTRFNLSFAPDSEAQLKMLQNAFQGSTVEPIEGGQFIIRGVLDPQRQQVVDMLVDEQGMSLKDVADVADLAPELAAAIVGARTGGRVAPKASGRLATLAKEAIGGAIGAQSVGALSDAAMSSALGTELSLMQIASQRGKGALLETATGGAIGGGLLGLGKLTKRGLSPITPAAQGAQEAVENIAQQTGIRIPLSYGIETGRPNIQRAEIIGAKTPTGGGFFRRQEAATEQSMRDVQRYLFGEGPLPTSESVGIAAVARLRNIARDLDEQVISQRSALADRATAKIASAIESQTGIAKQVEKDVAGRAVQDSVKIMRQQHRDVAGELYAGIEDLKLPTRRIQSELDAIQKELVKSTKTETVASPILDPISGKAITSTTTAKEVITELTPEGVGKFLRGAAKLDPEMPLSELRALRTTLNDAIGQPDVFAGVPDRILKKLSNSITEAIDEGAEALGKSPVAERLAQANAFYKEINRFQVQGIEEILADPTMRKLGPFAIVNQALRDPDQYFRMRELLTKDIPLPTGGVGVQAQPNTWKMFQRAMLTEMEERATLTGTGNLMNAQTFINDLNKLEPAVLRDLLGSRAPEIISSLKTMSTISGKVNAKEMVELLSKESFDAGAVKRLADAEVARDAFYDKNIVKKFLKGDLETTAINPGEFVERYLDLVKDKTELARVMSVMGDDPNLVRQIQRKTIQKIFHDAARNPSADEITRRLGTDPTVMVDPRKMLATIGNTETAEKLRTVLGSDTFNLLRDYLKVSAAVGAKHDSAQAVGGLIGGSLMSSIMTLDLKALPAHLKYAVLGQLLTSPTIRGALKAGKSLDSGTAIRGAVVSGAFIQGMMEDLGEGSAIAGMEMLAETLGLAQADEPPQDEPSQLNQRGMQILRELEAKNF